MIRAGVGGRVVRVDVDAAEAESCDPAGADHAAADRGRAARVRALASSATPGELQIGAHLVRPLDRVAEALDDLHRALDQIGVRGELATTQVQVVLQPDPDVAAGDRGERDVLQLLAADAERAERPASRGCC